MYRLQQGPTEEKIIEQCVRQHRPLPDTIANAPELFFGLELYFVAYCELSTCRGADGYISWLAIHQYAEANHFSQDQREDLFFHVARMEKTYGEFQEKKRAK